MNRFVLEPILFSIFGELLYPNEPVEYVMPYSSVIELYELQDSDQIVTDPVENARVRENLKRMIAFFDQPFVKKKIDRILKMPWSKSAPILYHEGVTFTVVFAIDNAEYGESFDPVETELILLAKRENLPLVTDHIEFQQRVVDHKLPIQVLDVSDFGFVLEEEPQELLLPDEEDEILHLAPIASFEAQEGTVLAAEEPQLPKKENTLLPWIMGGFILLLIASFYVLFQ